jgi:hypothetical protein
VVTRRLSWQALRKHSLPLALAGQPEPRTAQGFLCWLARLTGHLFTSCQHRRMRPVTHKRPARRS